MKPENLRDSLSEYRSDEFPDCYYCPNECCWDTAAEMLVQSDALLGLCGCGLDTDFNYILGGLELIADKGPMSGDSAEWDKWWEGHKTREAAHFGNEAAAQFFYKWLDREGLSEHGGSVPGWLTQSGLRLLRLMREAYADTAAGSAAPREEGGGAT